MDSLPIITTIEQGLETLDQIEIELSRWRHLKHRCRLAMAAILKQSGPQVIGEFRYRAGVTKSHKCNDVRSTFCELVELLDEDYSALAGMLSSNPFKYGAMRKLLGEDFEVHYTTTQELDENGDPLVTLQRSLVPKPTEPNQKEPDK